MAQIPETPQAAPSSEAQAPQPQGTEDALVKLHAQLKPISRGLAKMAREDPQGFIVQLPRMISGTLVKGLLILIEEVGARDHDHEKRISLIEGHPLLNLGDPDDEEDTFPDPNDPSVLLALLGDVLTYMDILQGLAERVPDQMGSNEAIQRLETNRGIVEGMRSGLAYVAEQMGVSEADQVEEEPPPQGTSPTSEDMTPPDLEPPADTETSVDLVPELDTGDQTPPEVKPEAASQIGSSNEESNHDPIDETPTAQ